MAQTQHSVTTYALYTDKLKYKINVLLDFQAYCKHAIFQLEIKGFKPYSLNHDSSFHFNVNYLLCQTKTVLGVTRCFLFPVNTIFKSISKHATDILFI